MTKMTGTLRNDCERRCGHIVVQLCLNHGVFESNAPD